MIFPHHVWAWPGNSQREHIFYSPTCRSLCCKWLLSSLAWETPIATDVPLDPKSYDCKECVKRFNKDHFPKPKPKA